MSLLLSLSRRHRLLNHPRLLLRRFTVDADPPPPESKESVEVQLLESLRKIPQHDWPSSETLHSLLSSSSSSSVLSPLALSKITRRLGSYSLAISFLHYLLDAAKSQSLNEESLSLVFQSVVEFAGSGSEPDAKDKLLRLYSTAKEKNIPLTPVATKLLIRWFSRMDMVNQSVLVYEGLDSSAKNNTQVRNVLIDVLFRNGRVDDAFKVLDEMQGSVFRPNRITAAIVFHEVWRGRLLKEDEIVGLISRFGSHGVAPNCVWLTRFITSLCRNARRTDVAWEVLRGLMKNGAPLQAPSFNALLTVLGRNMEISRMNDVVVKMEEMKIRPDVVTLGILINTLCKSRRVDEALEVFQQMCGKRSDDGGDVIKADSIHFNTLIDGLCKVGRMKEAEELLVKMKTEESCCAPPTTVTYNCLVGGYCIAGQLETAKEVVSRMKEDGLKPNVVTLNTLVGGMCRHHGVNMAIGFFRDMQREGLKGNVVTYTTLIHAYCSVGNVENAMGLFDQMLEAGCSPDAKIYYALISGLCQARRDHDAVRVVEKLKQAGFSLDLLAYNMLIGLFCDKNNGEKVYEMLTDMEEAKMKPDSITYNTLVSFFCKLEDFESVQKMMENMREDGLHPTVVTYGVIIEAYCSAGDVNEALKLFNDMGSRSKVSPNTVIYNILINAFCKAGNLGQAMSLKEDMKEKMVRPNVETYNALFKCLNEVHQKETVFKLMDEMNQSSCEANQTTVEILMERLTGSDDLIKLKQFMQGYPVGYQVEKNFTFPCP
ncbi:Pentatricopeptide repeat-containing protein [Raphanus sativus]|uniref:Pentatricopeptide repeat-containing protein At3g61520, mitochondrial n=1 Tax=Raphanus sativus TaxID=3726 RepID=A0A6J0LHC7_RAPSA|nr:pentatricopeptide repeat-containing protein At3g61520, mitochondrial [Raphanus sativus]KAJ4911935.1 Pentatricopeptide repeat-containing protein [Raphanus sativus]